MKISDLNYKPPDIVYEVTFKKERSKVNINILERERARRVKQFLFGKQPEKAMKDFMNENIMKKSLGLRLFTIHLSKFIQEVKDDGNFKLLEGFEQNIELFDRSGIYYRFLVIVDSKKGYYTRKEKDYLVDKFRKTGEQVLRETYDSTGKVIKYCASIIPARNINDFKKNEANPIYQAIRKNLLSQIERNKHEIN